MASVETALKDLSEALRRNGFGVPVLRFDNWADGMAIALGASIEPHNRSDGTSVLIYQGIVVEFPTRVRINTKGGN